MIDFFKDWLPIVISSISMLASIASIIVSRRNTNKTNAQSAEFEIQKIKTHEQERNIDEIYMRLNSRSSLIPYFHLVLDDTKIVRTTQNHSERIKLEIGLINIGKESASNVMIHPICNGLENYFESTCKKTDKYFIYEYLNQNFAFPREVVFFSITRDIPDNEEKIVDFVRFKIRFRDLLGNLYEQEFQFGFDTYLLNGFSLESYSSTPTLVENK